MIANTNETKKGFPKFVIIKKTPTKETANQSINSKTGCIFFILFTNKSKSNEYT